MGKVLWKTAVLLGAIFCLSLSPGGVSAEIRMPDEGVTIILRAPMHHLQVVKQVKGKPDEIIPGLEVSLPENTPIRFKVDQVNTVLYKVQITATEEIPQHETGMEVWQQVFQMLFAGLSEKYQDLSFGAAKDPMQQVVACLKHKTQRAEELGKELDAYLQRTEKRQFYTGTAAEVNAGFARIKMDAAEAAKKALGLSSGTHGEILKTVQKTHQEICDVLATSAKLSVSKDSFDATINRFKTALTKVTAKLERIENATWQQEDTQIRILKNKMKLTCVITRIAQDSEDDSVERREFAVTLNPEGWGILISPMPAILVSTLRDASYVVREEEDKGKEMANRSTAENMPASDEAPGVNAMPEYDEMQAADAMPAYKSWEGPFLGIGGGLGVAYSSVPTLVGTEPGVMERTEETPIFATLPVDVRLGYGVSNQLVFYGFFHNFWSWGNSEWDRGWFDPAIGFGVMQRYPRGSSLYFFIDAAVTMPPSGSTDQRIFQLFGGIGYELVPSLAIEMTLRSGFIQGAEALLSGGTLTFKYRFY